MIKRGFRLLFSLVAACSFLLNAALAPLQAATSAGGYSITHFDVHIDVHENNTYAVTETIDVDFHQARHGIYRTLPRQARLVRADGTTSNSRVQITHISANVPYAVSSSMQDTRIRLGDEEQTVIGPQQYVIKYTYNAGADPLSDVDEFYYNLVGDGWDVGMDEVTFTIALPKEFETTTLGLSVGRAGSIDPSRAEYTVTGQQITGSVPAGISAGEAVTLRLTLPEGYFVGAGFPFNYPVLLSVIFALTAAGAGYWLWTQYGRDEPVVETVEFYPPDGLNSAEIGYAYHGAVTTDSSVSLLLYLADKGYVRIIDTGLKSRKKSFRIERLKNYDGHNEAEQEFFDGLFATSSSVDGTDLENSFYRTLAKVSTILTQQRKSLWWDATADRYQLWFMLVSLLAFNLVLGVPAVQNGHTIMEIIAADIAVGSFFLAACLGKSAWNRRLGLIGASIFSLVIWFMFIMPLLSDEPTAMVLDVIGLFASIGCLVAAGFMGRPTHEGTVLLGKVRGFKRFLETAEKPKLEALVAQNPSYFYNILPYTFALGVSSVWVDRFRDIALEPPDWYSSPNAFDAAHFAHFVGSTMSNASSVMASSPSSSGSSGGGVSGGGGGGGGGGSW